MSDEINKILDRLERIDHKEYSGGFEFADSASFDEMARCFEERKKMANYIIDLQKENKKMEEAYERLTEDYVLKKYIVKAIENIFDEVKEDDENENN